MRDRFDLGAPLSRRDAIAPSLAPAFNLTAPRTDRPELVVQDYEPLQGHDRLSQIAEFTLRNAARFVGHDLGALPISPAGAQTFWDKLFWEDGKFRFPTRLR
jgi:hypothetical protein